MRSIKTSVNLYRILEFTIRNIRQTIAYSTDSRTRKLPKSILGWASGAERIERAERNLQKVLSAPKGIWPLRSRSVPAPLPLHSAHMLWRRKTMILYGR